MQYKDEENNNQLCEIVSHPELDRLFCHTEAYSEPRHRFMGVLINGKPMRSACYIVVSLKNNNDPTVQSEFAKLISERNLKIIRTQSWHVVCLKNTPSTIEELVEECNWIKKNLQDYDWISIPFYEP